ncbi:MAG TPA: rRNA adenine N-6-methyltransferase family protein [Candidatus Dormibacteraeota bacterium]|nr:rRNA adenine N-6-methyltransferase family protein [Candidatus Dormibacteraeota bacterium]
MGNKKRGPSDDHHQTTNGHSAPGPLGEFFLFARNFLKHPDAVGWMLPSSPFVVDAVLKQVDWDKARVIVEYGPGVGTFTRKLLKKMHPEATLIALEINPDFCEFLNKTVADPRLRLVQESATEVEPVLKRMGLPGADYVISGIPFKTMEHDLRDEIVRKTHAALKPDGSFLVYQLSRVVQPYLEKVFSKVARDSQFLSFIPARMFYCAR